MKLAVSKLKLYLDTTIPSYVFALDSPERMAVTRRFMRLVGDPGYELLISDVVLQEINRAAPNKRALLTDVVRGLRVLPTLPAAKVLAQAYIEAKALPRSSFEDALHV